MFACALCAALSLPVAFTSCSDDSNTDSHDGLYSDKSYGEAAMNACDELGAALEAANNAIYNANLTAEQTAELQNILASTVDSVIVPTYTDLGTAVEKLQAALGDLSATQITQQNVNDACTAFKEARKLWEKSEAFLGGAASDFEIDPHIDSWPLNRTLMHNFFTDGLTEEISDDASVLGFHALEFILFRDGQPRKVSEFNANDTYKGFTDIKGQDELAYAQSVAKDLLNHVYELEVAWSATPNAKRLAAVQAAGLSYRTGKGYSYGENLKNNGDTQKSEFANLEAAIQQVLSADEGSCYGICNEVGGKKIGNPFSIGDVSYVESPYSYNSITDFADNIRSIENVWYGGRDGASSNATYSFHKFFAANQSAIATRVENAIKNAINKIEAMPAPFVKYVSTIWGVNFEDAQIPEGGDEE